MEGLSVLAEVSDAQMELSRRGRGALLRQDA